MNVPHRLPEHDPAYTHYLPAGFRQYLEDHFYARVAEKARLPNLKADKQFLRNPDKHIGLYSDHGVVHVRDVACQTLQVVERANGVLIPRREANDLAFLQAYALQLAYLHDIGMVDFSYFGRYMHPEFAAQFVFTPEFDPLLDLLWEENAGNLPERLLNLFREEKKEENIRVLFREMLCLSVAHSKSKMPISVVNDPAALRRRIQWVLTTPLRQLYFEQKMEKLARKKERAEGEKARTRLESKREKLWKKQDKYLDKRKTPDIPALRFYDNFERESFTWLAPLDRAGLRFVLDVQDALRCLRAADALRQRGTVLRTSAGYEVFVDQKSANAVFALRSDDNEELYLLEGKKPINAGEANIAGSEIDSEGNLRISFHRGQFRTSKVVKKAASNAAVAVDDIQADTIHSFLRDPDLDRHIYEPPARSFHEIRILMEGVEDNPDFAHLVFDELRKRNPTIEHRLRVSVSLQGADPEEIERYLGGRRFRTSYPSPESVQDLVQKISDAGHRFEQLDDRKAFAEVRIVTAEAGERLIRSGSPSGFVYVPLTNGLRVFPLGGYESKPASAWVPLGNTGVIRGSVRNANVFAEETTQLLMVPREVYLEHWYTPYNARTLMEVWKG